MTSPRRGLTSSHGTSTGDGDWWERAACRNADPDAFAPPPDEYRIMTTAEAAYARTYCARCPVTAECLNDALAKGDDYGIRGGIDMATATTTKRRTQQAAANPQPPRSYNPCQEDRRELARANALKRIQEGRAPTCGTRAGYDHHRALSEPYCDDCRTHRRESRRNELRIKRQSSPGDTLVAEVQHLVSVGAGIHEVARATGRSTEALERALYRRQQHELVAKLKRAA